MPVPIKGRRIKLPQASLRRELAKIGIGAAITHEELFQDQTGDTELESIDLIPYIGTTKLHIYSTVPLDELPSPVCDLAKAIQSVFASGQAKRG